MLNERKPTTGGKKAEKIPLRKQQWKRIAHIMNLLHGIKQKHKFSHLSLRTHYNMKVMEGTRGEKRWSSSGNEMEVGCNSSRCAK